MQGTLQACRANLSEPKLAAELPAPPNGLSERVREQYLIHGERLLLLRVMTPADVGGLVALAEACVERMEASERIEKDGGVIIEEPIVFEGEIKGHRLKKHPAVAIRSDADKRYLAWCTRFGLTPADRSRVSALPEPQKANRFARLVVEMPNAG